MLAARPAFLHPRAFANPEPDLITTAATERGDVFTVSNGELTQSAFVVRLSSDATEPLRNTMTALGSSMNTLTEQANHARSQVHPARFPDVMRDLITRNVSPAFQAATKAGVSEKRDADAAWKRSTAIEPAVGTVRQEYRQLWKSLSLGERLARAKGADYEELAAILEGRGFFSDMNVAAKTDVEQDDMPTRIWGEIHHRFALLGTAKLHSLNGAFTKEPTASEPLATGPDNKQIEAAARKLNDNHKQRINDIEAVESSMRSVITAIAAATELPIEVAYRLLMGRE